MQPTQIKFLGCTNIPSAQNCPDGQLDLALNLSADAADQYIPVPLPTKILDLGPGAKPLTIHSTPDGNRNLIYTIASGQVAAIQIPQTEQPNNQTTPTTLTTRTDVTSAVALGNTIILCGTDGISYLLWKNGSYRDLGQKPPFTTLQFGLLRKGILDATKKYSPFPMHLLPTLFNFEPGTDEPDDQEQLKYAYNSSVQYHNLTNAALGLLLSQVADNVTANGLFYQPFFIRYAYRLYDGSLYWASAPVLMLTDPGVPTIKLFDAGKVSQKGYGYFTLGLNVPYFALQYGIPQVPQGLKDWEDIITGIDIFISAPLYTFHQGKDLAWAPDLTSQQFLNYKGRLGGLYSIDGTNFKEWPTDGIKNTTKPSPQDWPSHCYLRLERPDNCIEQFSNTHTFYRIASLELNDILNFKTPKNSTLTDLKISRYDIEGLLASETLPDDFQSHCSFYPQALSVYNSRLCLAAPQVSMPQPLPWYSLTPYATPPTTEQPNDPTTEQPNDSTTEQPTDLYIKVWSKANGIVGSTCLRYPDVLLYARMPRYIFYPDINAFKIELWSPAYPKTKFTFPLKPHQHLYGAFFFAGLNTYNSNDYTHHENASLKDQFIEASSRSDLKNRIYTSQVLNPFSFSPEAVSSVGNGNIMALMPATKAMSQGQFGQFPMYAFTSEGVWALDVSNNGSFSSVTPITRDVISGPNAILQLDNTVAFATARGLTLLDGAQCKCISTAIEAPAPDPITSLPALNSIIPQPHDFTPLREFLPGALMAYDYPGQRIIISNHSKYPYDLILNLRSAQWSMAQLNIQYPVNAYPSAFAINNDGALIDLAPDSGHTALMPLAAIITRPFKISSPEEFLSISAIRLSASDINNDCRTILYGTRDYHHWHIVAAAAGPRITAFSGSPYRAFRLAIVFKPTAASSISGCSLILKQRFPSKF